MKQRLIWAVILLVALLMTAVASCAPAPTPVATSNTTVATPPPGS